MFFFVFIFSFIFSITPKSLAKPRALGGVDARGRGREKGYRGDGKEKGDSSTSGRLEPKL